MIDLEELGLKLQMQRKLAKLTQEELAKKADISYNSIQK